MMIGRKIGFCSVWGKKMFGPGRIRPGRTQPTENGTEPSKPPSDVFPTVKADPASRTTRKSPNPGNPAGREAGSATVTFTLFVAPGLIDTFTRGRLPSENDLAGSSDPSAAGGAVDAT